MKTIITGGAGFLGLKLANTLLASEHDLEELVLADVVAPAKPISDPRVKTVTRDLTNPDAISELVTAGTSRIFHLAAIVSSHAEADFDLGWKVNLDLTRNLLEQCRRQNPGIRLVFSSSVAVFGGELPDLITDNTLFTPQSSYGTQKAIGELLVNDYSRRGYVDGRSLRLPTVCVRPGRPNKAASSFVSSIIREPLNEEEAVCPVAEDYELFLTSPNTVVDNILHMSRLDAGRLSNWRTLNAPGITLSVKEMLEALERIAGPETRQRVRFESDATLRKIVETWASRVDNSKALSLGFSVDPDFDSVIKQHLELIARNS